MPFGNSFEDRVNRKLDRAGREYDEIVSAQPKNQLGAALYWTPGREATRIAVERRAALEYLGSVLLFFIAEYSLEPISGDELRDRVGVVMTGIRAAILENKWPRPQPIMPDWEIEVARELDGALIQWLESQPDWKQYEARTVPRIPVDDAENEPHQTAAGPLFYLRVWPIDGFSVSAKSRIQAGLLGIHGDLLDKIAGRVECWRRAYDLVAWEFGSAGLLSEETVNMQIPNLVADACAGGGWFEEGWGSLRPTGIFSERLGSRYYPRWRRLAFMEVLRGRIAHWSGRLLLGRTTADDGLTSTEPLHTGHSHEESSRALKAHRLKILKAYIAEKSLGCMDRLAGQTGTTKSALYGMTRGDSTRYSPETLDRVLKKVGCSQAEWHRLPNPDRLA